MHVYRYMEFEHIVTPLFYNSFLFNTIFVMRWHNLFRVWLCLVLNFSSYNHLPLNCHILPWNSSWVVLCICTAYQYSLQPTALTYKLQIIHVMAKSSFAPYGILSHCNLKINLLYNYTYSSPPLIGTPLQPSNSVHIRGVSFGESVL